MKRGAQPFSASECCLDLQHTFLRAFQGKRRTRCVQVNGRPHPEASKKGIQGQREDGHQHDQRPLRNYLRCHLQDHHSFKIDVIPHLIDVPTEYGIERE